MVCFSSRRWYFLSRITLLGLTLFFGSTLVGCSQSSTSDFLKKQQALEKAIAALTDLGAKIEKADTDHVQGWVVDLSQVPFTPEIARQLNALGSTIDVLNLSKTSINDNQLSDLIDQKALDAVVELNLSHNPAITDQSLEKMASLSNLRDLDLVETRVTEGGIARLQEKRIPRPDPSDAMIERLEKSMPERAQKRELEAYKNELKIRH